jgi:hypothetical protein
MTLSELTRLLEPAGIGSAVNFSFEAFGRSDHISVLSTRTCSNEAHRCPNNGVRKDWPFCLTPVTVPVIVVRDHRADLPITVCWLTYGIHEEQVEGSERIRIVDEWLC